MAGEFNAGSVVARLKLVDDGYGATLKRAIGDASTFQKGMMAAGAAAVTMGVAVAALTKQAADYTDKLGKLAQQIGMTTEQISSFALAAGLSDLSTEEFGKSVSQLNRKMVDAASGNVEAAKSFQQLGLSVKNSNGTLKSSEQMLEEIADKFAGAKDSATKTALAMDLMGRAGAQMIPLLNGGKKEIQAVREEAQKMGLVFSRDAFKAAEEFNDAQTRIGQSLIGLRQQISETIIKLVNQTGIFDMVAKAIQKVTGWWMGLSESTREAIISTAAFIGTAVAAAGAFAAISTAASALLPLLAPIIAGLGPIGIALVAISAATFLVIKYWNNLSALFATLKPIIMPVIDALKTIVSMAWAPLVHAFETMKKVFSDFKGVKVPDLALMVITNLVNPIENFGMHVSAIFGKFLPQAVQKFLNITMDQFKNWGDTLKAIIRAAIDPLNNTSIAEIISTQFSRSVDEGKKFVGEMTTLYNKISSEARESAKASGDARIKFYKDELETRRQLDEEDKRDRKGEIAAPAGTPGPETPKEKKTLEMSMGLESGTGAQIQQWGDKVFGLISKISADNAQIAQNNLTKIGNFASLWVDVYKNNLEKAHEAEREQLQAQEDEKLNILRAALDTRLMLINEEFAARKAALEAELVLQKQGIDEMTALRIADAESKSVDAEERTAAVRTIEEDGIRQKSEADKEHQAKVDAERQKFQTKAAAETKKANDEYEAEKQASAKRMTDLEKKQADEKKEIAKKGAAFQYAISLASFHLSQQQAMAQAKIQYAQAMMSAVTSGMQIPFPLSIAAIAALMGMATLAFGSSMAAIASTPPPMPPAELFMKQGGMVPGPLHSQGGVKAELEGGEYVMPRGPAMANLGVLEAMRDGRMNGAGGITVIVHVGSLDPAGRSIDSVGRELGLSVRSHL